MDLLVKALSEAAKFNDYGKGLLITYAVSRAIGIGASHENVPEHLARQWRKATRAVDALPDVVQLAFARALIDELGSRMMETRKR